MAWYCKLIGHTYLFRTENPKVAWNVGKDMVELHITADQQPRTWLECRRCGDRIEEPTREQVRRATNNSLRRA